MSTYTSNTTEHLYCPVHRTRRLEFNCRECQKPICSECFVADHNEHKLEKLENVYPSLVSKMKQVKKEIQTVLIPKYQELISKENAKMEELSKKTDKVQENIEDHTKKLLGKAINIKETMIHSLRKDEQLIRESFADNKRELERRVKVLETLNDSISESLKIKKGIVFFRLPDTEKLQHLRKFPSSKHYYLQPFHAGTLNESTLECQFGNPPKFDLEETKGDSEQECKEDARGSGTSK
ncbi:E3 ubiquitin-protein ligase TRIM45-like [Saccostrea cucullata]|uniref:E3 ubiquitin-protein ligase TRIM45-like n=1 Tax=Saccostrea cuccullata TaxID=36930 RepID=UPI002ED621AF